MKISSVVLNVVAALAVVPATIYQFQPTGDWKDICPESYVAYPEASHVVQPGGLCRFDTTEPVVGI